MANPFGFGGTPCSEAATAGKGTSTNNLAAATAGVYYWTSIKTKAVVFSHPDNGPTLLYGQWNDIAADPTTTSSLTASTSTTEWDFVIEPGNYAVQPDGLPVKSVGLYCVDGATVLTDFQVRGF